MRNLCYSLLLLVLPTLAHAAEFDAKKLQTYLETHCVSCHSADDPKGKFRIDNLKVDFAKPADMQAWTRIFSRVHSKEMPPPNKKQPPTDESKVFLQGVADGLEKTRKTSGLRRLTRAEFEYTLRDIFDLPQLDIREMLPVDGEVGGFDKVSDALGLSHAQLASYLSAIEEALDQSTAIALRPERPKVTTTRLRPQDEFTWTNRASGGQVIPLAENGTDPILNLETGKLNVKNHQELAKGPQIYAMGSLFHYDAAGRLMLNEARKLPHHAGLYKVRLSVYTFDWDKGKVVPAKGSRPFSLSNSTRILGYFDAPPDKPKTIEFETWVEPHDMFHFNPVSLPHGVGLDKEGAKSWKGGGVAIQYLEVEGPIMPEGPPVAKTLLYGDLPLVKWTPELKLNKPSRKRHKLAWWVPEPPLYTPTSTEPMKDAERLILGFLRKAYRRPVKASEAEPYLAVVKQKLEGKATLEESLRAAYKAVLVSPDFLFIDTSEPNNDFGIASRLSYLLWCSMPDEELFTLAEKGKLKDAKVLREQTERLMKSPKYKRFEEDFTNQWLKLTKITATSPDPQLYPHGPELESDVAQYMWDSMTGESRAFVTELLKNDLPTRNVIHSEFTMLNDIMAKHYGLPKIEGAGFRKVELKPEYHRGGIITQASVLKISANGTVTSPVMRGAWIMSNIMNQTPPPPPEAVAAIDPDVRGTTTIRERLAKHREQASCAGCHARFDPAGFALENYDVLGNWREKYRIVKEKRMDLNGPPVDASGVLINGKEFKNIDDFKKNLLSDETAIARAVAGKFLTYATGRIPTPSDNLEIDQIIDNAKSTQYGMRSLLLGVIGSKAFRGN